MLHTLEAEAATETLKSAWAIYSVSLCLKEPREKRWRRRGREEAEGEEGEEERPQNWPLASVERLCPWSPKPLGRIISQGYQLSSSSGWVGGNVQPFPHPRFGLELRELMLGLQRQAAGAMEQDLGDHDLSVMSLSKLHLWATCTDKSG